MIPAINNRGSSGYGKTFHALDDRPHGEVDLIHVAAREANKSMTGARTLGRDRIAALGYSAGPCWASGRPREHPDSGLEKPLTRSRTLSQSKLQADASPQRLYAA